MNEIKFWLKNHDYAWKYKLTVCLPLFVFLTIIDWGSKLLVQFTMHQSKGDWDIKHFIDGFLNFKYQINPGSAYGANANNVALSIALATVITFLTAVIIVFINDKKWLIPIVFLFAGSVDNLIARSWAPAVIGGDYDGTMGGVIDFMVWDFKFLGSDSYIFNMADMWVNIGVILLILLLIYEVINHIVVTRKRSKIDDLETPDQELYENIKVINSDEKIKEEVKQIDKETQLKRIKKEIKAENKLKKIKEKQNGKNTNSRRN